MKQQRNTSELLYKVWDLDKQEWACSRLWKRTGDATRWINRSIKYYKLSATTPIPSFEIVTFQLSEVWL